MAGSGACSLYDYFGYQARVKIFDFFHGPVLRSCSSLPPLPFRSTLLLDSFTKTRSPVELQSLPIP